MRHRMSRIILSLGVLGLGIAGVLWWTGADLSAALNNTALSHLLTVNKSSESPQSSALPADGPLELVDDGWCSTHRRPEAGCRDCSPSSDSIQRDCVEKLPIIRLSGPDVARRIGLETAPVTLRMHADSIVDNASIAYNEHAYTEVRPRVAGLVHEAPVDHGQVVRKGDLIAVIDSAEVGSAKAEYLAALPVVELAEATLQRTQSLTRSNALPMKDELAARSTLNQAKAQLLNAAQRLRNLGFKDTDLEEIARNQDTSSLLTIVAPIEGTVIERHAVPGEAVEPTHQLVAIADVRKMWAWIDVYENEVDRVAPGQEIVFRINEDDPEGFVGKVEWVETAVNPVTRTIRVRAELDNPHGRLRANQFGVAEIRVGEPHRALFVPSSAVQVVDDTHLVFLPQPDGSYRPQRVLLEEGEHLQGEEEVLWGLEEGQEVVTTGSFLLKSEILKDQLAGD